MSGVSHGRQVGLSTQRGAAPREPLVRTGGISEPTIGDISARDRLGDRRGCCRSAERGAADSECNDGSQPQAQAPWRSAPGQRAAPDRPLDDSVARDTLDGPRRL